MANSKTPQDLLFESLLNSWGIQPSRFEDVHSEGPDYEIDSILFEVYGFDAYKNPTRMNQLKHTKMYDGYLATDVRAAVHKKAKQFKKFLKKYPTYSNRPYVVVVQDFPNSAFPPDYLGEALYGDLQVEYTELGFSRFVFGPNSFSHHNKNTSVSALMTIHQSFNSEPKAVIVLNKFAKNQITNSQVLQHMDQWGLTGEVFDLISPPTHT